MTHSERNARIHLGVRVFRRGSVARRAVRLAASMMAAALCGGCALGLPLGLLGCSIDADNLTLDLDKLPADDPLATLIVARNTDLYEMPVSATWVPRHWPSEGHVPRFEFPDWRSEPDLVEALTGPFPVGSDADALETYLVGQDGRCAAAELRLKSHAPIVRTYCESRVSVTGSGIFSDDLPGAVWTFHTIIEADGGVLLGVESSSKAERTLHTCYI